MTPFAETSTSILSVSVIIIDILIVYLVFIACAVGAKTKNLFIQKTASGISKRIYLIGFIASLAALLGSLFYSNIVGFVPCELCWWARILIYPQVILFGVALYNKHKGQGTAGLLATSLIMSILGALLTLYQSYGQLLNPNVLPACDVSGVSCAILYFVKFGYVTIPTMALSMFLFIVMAIIVRIVYNRSLAS